MKKSNALRSAGHNVAATNELGAFADILPAFALADPDETGLAFSTLTVTTPAVNGAQGILAADQAGAFAALTLGITLCPNIKEVCGFNPGTTAIITDGAGHHDLFEVTSIVAGARMLNADRGLSQAYPAGSAVIMKKCSQVPAAWNPAQPIWPRGSTGDPSADTGRHRHRDADADRRRAGAGADR